MRLALACDQYCRAAEPLAVRCPLNQFEAGVMIRTVLFIAATCTACSSAGEDVALPSRTDSAGVEILSYGPLRAWTEGPPITEVLRIGSLEGPDEEVFSRLAGGFIFPDGSIALVDRDALEIRQFDASGRFVRIRKRRRCRRSDSRHVTSARARRSSL